MGSPLLDSIQAAWSLPGRDASGAWDRERRTGRDLVAARGLPQKSEEAWRHTSLADLAAQSFIPAPPQAPLPAALVDRLTEILDAGDFPLVFVDGFLHLPGGSRALPAGFHAKDLRGEAILPPVFQQAPDSREPFEAVNRSLCDSAWLLTVDEGVRLEAPIHVVNLHSPAAAARMSHGRLYLRLGRGASLRFLSSHLAPGAGAPSFATHAVRAFQDTESRLEFLHASAGNPGHSGVQTISVHQKAKSFLDFTAVCAGGLLSRLSLEHLLDGEGAEARLRGLYPLDGAKHNDIHVHLRHAAPDGKSRQTFRGVLDGKSRAVFTGKVTVDKGAHGTDAGQSNRTLLLSPDARVDARPQLEIYNDDVKCAHGATTGQLREEELFYLTSRGIPREQARALLAAGFVEDLLGAIPEGRLRLHARAWLAQHGPSAQKA
ncbi:MAG: Fe-S cluster assembly protein SufD [Spirochaetes bacterium]|nr:Fe-S cluster assembly protein SufD [Spirochaetota bacterium]